MMSQSVIGMSPFETPDVGLVESLTRAGAIGVLDLGRQQTLGLDALQTITKRGLTDFGVRIPQVSLYSPDILSNAVSLVILDAEDLRDTQSSGRTLAAWRKAGRQVWVQVCSLAEARELFDATRDLNARPDGLIIKGSESGGRVGLSSSLILIQEIKTLSVPFWVQGGIGMHSAAACLLAGATGVVLDSQLALLRESSVGEEIKKAIQHAEGTETRLIHSHQVFNRPDLKLPHDSEISKADFIKRLGAESLKGNFIPAGQDLCFARGFGEKHKNVRTLVHSLKRSMKGHLRQAKAHCALEPHSPMALANGTHYGLAQGPMTRVSDNAEFINAVSD
ncbi:MAG: hypothetical protein EOP09_08660, partial [Proteobacteria bacterium]